MNRDNDCLDKYCSELKWVEFYNTIWESEMVIYNVVSTEMYKGTSKCYFLNVGCFQDVAFKIASAC